MPPPTRIDLDEFTLMRDYIETSCGIHLTEEKMYLVETRLTTLMVENRCHSFTELYQKAIGDKTYRLRDKIVEAMTTNETLWFRDAGPFSVFEEILRPKFAEEVQSGKRLKIRIWCAACSTGQEPYSIAMTILEFTQKYPSLRPIHFDIIATDISSTALYLAMAGRYDAHAISRGLTEELRNKYFTKEGKVWEINNTVKNMVRYRKMNLQEDFSILGKQDIVFCRNVLIYFSDEFKQDILRRIAVILRPNGYLFLGTSESIINFTREYELMRHTRGLYYQVKNELH